MHLHNLAFGDCHPPHVDVVDAFVEVAPLHTFSFSCVVAVLSTLTFLALGLAGIIWLGPQFFLSSLLWKLQLGLLVSVLSTPEFYHALQEELSAICALVFSAL